MSEIKILQNSKQKIEIQKKFISIFVLLCLLWIISFFKIPIVGKIIDAIFFEFLFGYSKIIIYILLLIMLITWYFKNIFYTMFSKRKIFSYILIILFTSIVLGTISHFLNLSIEKNYFFKDFFIGKENSFFDRWNNENIKNLLKIKESFLILNRYSFGGFIGTFYIALTDQTFHFVIFFSNILIFVIVVFVSILCWSDKVLNKLKNKLCSNNKEIKISRKISLSKNVIINDKKEKIINQFNLMQNEKHIIDENITVIIGHKNKENILLDKLDENKIKNV